MPIDDAARADLHAAIAEARRLRDTVERPPIADNERLCARCSLAPVCLPEEVRQEREPERDPVRLFPPDRDGTTLHVVSQGAQVGCSGDSLVVRPRDQPGDQTPDSRRRYRAAARLRPGDDAGAAQAASSTASAFTG